MVVFSEGLFSNHFFGDDVTTQNFHLPIIELDQSFMGVNRVNELNKCAAGRAVALGVLLYGYVLAVNSQLKVF